MNFQQKLFKLAIEMSDILNKIGSNRWDSDFTYKKKNKKTDVKISIAIKETKEKEGLKHGK